MKNLERSEVFNRDILGLQALAYEKEKAIAFRIKEGQILLLFKKGAYINSPVPHDSASQHHLAFLIDDQDYEAWVTHLQSNKISIENQRPDGSGGRRPYFRDPDNHLLELLTPRVWNSR